MLPFLIKVISFFLLLPLSKLCPLKPLPSWVSELTLLLVLLCKESLCFFAHWLKSTSISIATTLATAPSRMSVKKVVPKAQNAEESEAMSVLDLPDLVVESILGRLPPSGLCKMAVVCSSMRDWCRSDHLWERHMREKWGRIIGKKAYLQWQSYVAFNRDFCGGTVNEGKAKGWMGALSCVWPISWLRSKLDSGSETRSSLRVDSIMSWYLALESGKFWFPAQVYNRENGHAGFMLSCYDAELSYDSRTDTFHARYPPHGRRTMVIEDGVTWSRLRSPPVDTPAHDLHISDCLNDLWPGDHIEIQWRKNKEFPYGWWYGVVGHLESCDENGLHCYCHKSDTVVLEFNHYASGSRWRLTFLNRKDHREEGDETNGFYGGIRKLHNEDEISSWRQFWPTEILE